MCYFDHKVMMILQLGAWQTRQPLRPHERENEYHARLHAQKLAQHRPSNKDSDTAPARTGWRLMRWLRGKRAKNQPAELEKPLPG